MQEVNKPLSQRQKQILKAVIESHIANGEPVGSKYLVENKQIASSSATIRNEMAELERRGYLEQPHTSAGRIPSEAGYRFYVDTLLEEYAMTTREIQEINEMMKAKVGELDQSYLCHDPLHRDFGQAGRQTGRGQTLPDRPLG